MFCLIHPSSSPGLTTGEISRMLPQVLGWIRTFCLVPQSVNLDVQAGLYLKCPFPLHTCLWPRGKELLLNIQLIAFRFHIFSQHFFFFQCIFCCQSPCQLLEQSELAILDFQGCQELGSKKLHNWETITQLSNQLPSDVSSWFQPKPCPFHQRFNENFSIRLKYKAPRAKETVVTLEEVIDPDYHEVVRLLPNRGREERIR